jgi:hypothetical protein
LRWVGSIDLAGGGSFGTRGKRLGYPSRERMIWKSGYRFSEKIMLKQKTPERLEFRA